MRFSEVAVAIAFVALAGCSNSSSATGTFPPGSGSLTPSCNAAATFTRPGSPATNAMSVSVNGSQCTGAGASGTMYPDEICATVTICTPGCDGQCQTINDILVDTGSPGLRIFSNVLNIPLKQVSNDGTSAVAECVGFGDGSSEWGPVELADVMLAGEPTVKNVPIMVINSNYASPPDQCSSNDSYPDTNPQEAGFNGIIGVTVFGPDCGSECASDSGNEEYYACQNGNGNCGGTTVETGLQVTNPVAMLSQDNNGVILKLPAVANGGTTSVDSGTLVFGIDTQTNNASTGMTFLSSDSSQMEFGTTFQSNTMPAFIDSGSSDLAFATNSFGDCSAYTAQFGTNGSEFYCPGSGSTGDAQSLTATQLADTGTGSKNVSFSIENAYYLLFVANGGNNEVFSTIGGPTGGEIGGFFDWGLPFFFGKNVAVSIDGTSFNQGTGPGWAY